MKQGTKIDIFAPKGTLLSMNGVENYKRRQIITAVITIPQRFPSNLKLRCQGNVELLSLMPFKLFLTIQNVMII